MKKEKTIKNHTASNYLLTIARRLVLVLVLFLFTYRIYLFNRYLFASLELADWPDLLRGGLRFDLAALFYLNGLYMLLALLPFPFVSKGWQLF